jgi:hypothetical protein
VRRNLHAYLGFRLASQFREFDGDYEGFVSLKETDPKLYGHWRKLAKPIGLGFPGGLGPAKMVVIAKRDYGVDFVALAKDREFEVGTSVLYHAKRLYGFDEETFQWTPELKGIALAKEFQDVWFDTYPEMRLFLKGWVSEQGDPETPVLNAEEVEIDDEIDEIKGLCYTSPMGMHRAASTYTAVANGRALQSPAAEGFKEAFTRVVRETRIGTGILRGMRVVNEVHDEVIIELKDDDLLMERASEVKRIMEEGMSVVIKDVPIKANPVLMRRWWKTAEGPGIVGPAEHDPALVWAKELG